MSARHQHPRFGLWAEAMIRRRPGSNTQGDGFLRGRCSTRPRVLVRADAQGLSWIIDMEKGVKEMFL